MHYCENSIVNNVEKGSDLKVHCSSALVGGTKALASLETRL